MQINTDTAVYTGLGLSAYTDNGATSHYVRCSCGLLNHERAPNGNKYYYLFDGLGSIVGMTDSNGNEVNRYDYDPYGVMVNQQEQTGFTNLFKFAGPTGCATSFISTAMWLESVFRGSLVFIVQRYYGFLLQQAWDEQLSVEPYVATIQTVLQSLLQPSSPPENHAR